MHSPGCDREKTDPPSWSSIVKRCGRDTVVCIVEANNIDGHPIRKIEGIHTPKNAGIRHLAGWQRPLLWWTGGLTMMLHIQSDRVKKNYVLLTHGWTDDKALVIAPPCDDNRHCCHDTDGSIHHRHSRLYPDGNVLFMLITYLFSSVSLRTQGSCLYTGIYMTVLVAPCEKLGSTILISAISCVPCIITPFSKES